MSDEKTLNQWLQLLKEFKGLPKLQLNRTFMQIGGYPHYENVCSNILAFFFDPSNEHGLQDLCYRALLQAVRVKNSNLVKDDELGSSLVNVEREVDCNGKRLDLVLTSDFFVVGIENKIWHQLNNDLHVYKTKVDSMSQANDTKPICIVLSIRKEFPDNGFIGVTYIDFFEQLKSLLGHYSMNANPKYLFYLNDFIKTIDEIQGDNMTKAEQEQIAFFKNNFVEIDELNKQYFEYRKRLNNEICSLSGSLDEVVAQHGGKINKLIVTKSTLVLNFHFKEGMISIDTCLNPKEWKSDMFPRKPEIKSLCGDVYKSLDVPDFKESGRGWILFAEDVSVDRETIRNRLVDYIDRIVRFMDHQA